MKVGRGAIAGWMIRSGERVWARLPAPARHVVERRFFYAVFNLTRVTNDNYGWRPDASQESEEDLDGV